MMEAPSKLLIPVSVILVLVAFSPTEAWYKQAAGPSYYSVGRASGLLSGIRRSPHVRRGEPADSGESAEDRVVSELLSHSSLLKRMVSGCLFVESTWSHLYAFGCPRAHERTSKKPCLRHNIRILLFLVHVWILSILNLSYCLVFI